ncbi:Hint domain-containing protein [Yoonia sp. BS5-3]|uniref:Hint domain-containing protein n=1 Tax=Yoonia phaeophyticola TaxID=3137369 RepID=A0ABZ2V193_9RHOB
MASFAVLGADVIQGGNINTNSTGGSNGQGEVTFNNGTAVFEDDDIVVFEVQDPTGTNEIGSGSSISDLTVFDSYADYQAYLASVDAGTPDTTLIKYDYAPQNQGQTATVQSDISGLGDSYVRFNANILQPQNGGPTLNNTLTIAPGTNIANATGAVVLDRYSDFDIDEDGTIDSGTVEVGNSDFYVGDYVDILNQAPVCYVDGTMILTDMGPRAIETLQVGDLVQTAAHGLQPIRWIGRRDLSPLELRLFPKLRPVHIGKGALGAGLPERDLRVSRQHRMLLASKIVKRMFGVDQALVPAIKLIDLPGISYDQGDTALSYIHLMFAQHEIIFAEGAPSESLYPGPEALKSLTNAARTELKTLFPQLGQDTLPPCAALVPTKGAQRNLIARHLKNQRSVLQQVN